jgi:hypothetical protein
MQNNTTGGNNTANGQRALYNNSTGSNNTANGYQALYFNSGSSNTALGYRTLYNNINGNNNTALGYNADVIGFSLSNATAIGNNAHVSQSNSLVLGDTTNVNVGIGTGAPTKKLDIRGAVRIVDGTQGANKVLTSDANGNASWQTAASSGWGITGNSGTSASTNFIGTTDSVALNFRVNNAKAGTIDPKNMNTFIGIRTGLSMLSGARNVAFGQNAMYYQRSGSDNIAIGYNSLFGNGSNGFASSGANVAIGDFSLYNNDAGSFNVGVGRNSLFSNTFGSNNTSNGVGSLYLNVSGNYNSAFGNLSLLSNTTGYYNTSVGYSADVNSGTYSNTTVIGNAASGTASNQVRLGNTSVSSIGGQVGWSTLSDGRFKENIKEEVPGLQFINQLRPVTYHYNTKKFDEYIMKAMPDSIKAKRMLKDEQYNASSASTYTGFIAQEVEAAANKISYNFSGVDKPKNDGDTYSLRYAEFTVPLVKAVQELSAENTQLKSDLAELKKQIEELKALVQATK